MLFCRSYEIEFDKMQIPYPHRNENVLYYTLHKDWFGDYRSLRFCAVASVAALFV